MTRIKESYKGQLLLLLTVVIAPVLIYKLAVGDTVRLWMQIREEREQKELLMEQNRSEKQANGPTEEPVPIGPTGTFAGKAFPDKQAISLSSFLFEVSTENGCVMESYTPYQNKPATTAAVIPVSSAEVVITGKFIPLVHIIYALEEFSRKWKIISTDMKASSPGRTDSVTEIKLIMIIQSIQT